MSYFFKMDKKVHRGEMDFFVHLDFVSMIFTDSYIAVVHLGEMDFFVHLSLERWTFLSISPRWTLLSKSTRLLLHTCSLMGISAGAPGFKVTLDMNLDREVAIILPHHTSQSTQLGAVLIKF